MSRSTKAITASKGLYIKLGHSGQWEKECLEKGILRLGYKETPFHAAASGDWEPVKKVWRKKCGDEGAATRHVDQIKYFFEADSDTLWVTFYGGTLWWCFANPGVRPYGREGSYRKAEGGWKNTDINGVKLFAEKLSGKLLKVQSFRGTICRIKEFEYLKRKLNGQLLPEAGAAVDAQNQLVQKIVPLLQGLSWQDFEVLVDLVFANSGWRRLSEVGKTKKTVDIELLLPTTGERAFVQVKSFAEKQDLVDYLDRLKDSTAYDRMFFVWHSGQVGKVGKSNAVLIGPERLARMVCDAGLTSWLLDKVS